MKITQPKIRQRYKSPDISMRLECAYDELATTNPGAMIELVKFDRRQARRDQVYERRNVQGTGKAHINSPECTDSMYIDSLPLSNIHKSICTMLLQGYIATDIAIQLGITQCMVSRYKQDILRAIRGKEAGIPGDIYGTLSSNRIYVL